jgi:hypothetical protein
VPLDREHARGVVQLLGDVLADAFERTAAAAHGRSRLMTDLAPQETGRQRLAFRLLFLRRRGSRLLALDLAGKRLEILVDRLLKQAFLFGAEGLAPGGELQPLEHRHLVRELVDRGLLVPHLGHQARGQRTHLRFAQLLDGCRFDHGTHAA